MAEPLAQMIYGTAQNAEQGLGQGVVSAAHSGAELALQHEQLGMEQQRMQMQMQQLQNAKVEKLYGFIQDAHKYSNGSDRNAFLKNAYGYAAAMGLDSSVLPKGALDGMGSDENMGRIAQIGNMVEAGIMNPQKALETINDKAALAKITPLPPEAVSLGKAQITPEMKDYMTRQTEVQTAAIRGAGTVPAADKQLQDFSKQVANPSSRAALGRPKQLMDAADAVMNLANAYIPQGFKSMAKDDRAKALDAMPEQQYHEIIRGFDRMISQSQPTVSGQENLHVDTVEGLAAKYGQKVLNVPIGSNKGAFIEQLLESVQRERDLNASKYKQSANALKSGYTIAAKKHGSTMDKMIDDVAAEPASAQPNPGGTFNVGGHQMSADQMRAFIQKFPKNPMAATMQQMLGGGGGQ